MKPNNSDGNSSGQSETSPNGLYFPPFLKTMESLPQQIDPAALYVGLHDGWVAFEDVLACTDYIQNLSPDQEVLVIRNGKELLEMLK